jgi:hypothetical protein
MPAAVVPVVLAAAVIVGAAVEGACKGGVEAGEKGERTLSGGDVEGRKGGGRGGKRTRSEEVCGRGRGVRRWVVD